MRFIIGICFYSLLLLFGTSCRAVVGNILFSDNFDDHDYAGWTKIDVKGSTTTLWTAESGEYGMLVVGNNRYGMSIAGNQEWTDYRYEFDMHVISGEDKNFWFRARRSPDNLTWWYNEVHVSGNGPGNVGFIKIGPYTVTANASYTFQNGSTYHWTVVAVSNHYQIFIRKSTETESIKLIDVFDNTINPLLNGAIG